jgi:hypothetical protein
VAGVRRFGRLAASPAFRERDLEHVVDGDHAEQAASRPIDSPPPSAIGRFSSRDKRRVALFRAGAFGTSAGVLVMSSLFLLGR